MGLTNYPNGISSFGVPVIGGAAMPLTGTHFFVDPVNGSDGNTGKSFNKAFQTPAKALTACTAGKNDVVYLIGNGQASGSGRVTTELVWNKDATHLIGIAAPTRVAGRGRIAWASTATKEDVLMSVSADGCMIANIHLFQDYATAAAQTALAVTGERNYFYNCHIAGGGNATGAAHASCTSMTLAGDGENTFENCTFGIDTVSSGAGANAVVTFSSAAVRNQFIGCRFVKYAGAVGGLFVNANTSGALDRYTIFDDCLFINSNPSITMTAAFAVHASVGGYLLVKGGGIMGLCSDWTAADNSNTYVIGYNMAGSGNLNTGLSHTTDVS